MLENILVGCAIIVCALTAIVYLLVVFIATLRNLRTHSIFVLTASQVRNRRLQIYTKVIAIIKSV